jgi:DNA-binding IclR family transcriptional regulator
VSEQLHAPEGEPHLRSTDAFGWAMPRAQAGASPAPAAKPAKSARPRADAPRAAPVKARSARRVIAVLEFLGQIRGAASLREISLRFGWPQSSTSELMSVLIELGMVYKAPGRRLYSATPRAAWLVWDTQPPIIRSGRLHRAMDTLAQETGCSTAIVGKVGLTAQILSWRAGAGERAANLHTGMASPLHESAAGWLLLSTLGLQVWPRVLHRLRAEATDAGRFDMASLGRAVERCAQRGEACGPAGFGPGLQLCAALVPDTAPGQPLALAIVSARTRTAPGHLLAQIHHALKAAESGEPGD